MTTVETDQVAWMREQLARFTYRPGWLLTVEQDRLFKDAAILVIDYPAADSRNPSSERRFACRRAVWFAEASDPDSFGRHVQRAVMDAELHESREWLKRDGVLFDDPHADPNRWNCTNCGGVGPVRTKPGKPLWACPGCGTVVGPEQPEEI